MADIPVSGGCYSRSVASVNPKLSRGISATSVSASIISGNASLNLPVDDDGASPSLSPSYSSLSVFRSLSSSQISSISPKNIVITHSR